MTTQKIILSSTLKTKTDLPTLYSNLNLAAMPLVILQTMSFQQKQPHLLNLMQILNSRVQLDSKMEPLYLAFQILNFLQTLGTSGINKVLQTSNSTNYFVLDYSNLSLAGDVSSNIRTDNTFVAVQLDGTGSSSVGKMSLQGLADYVSSGASSIAENCNIIISNAENELIINAAANTRSVMIGCDVAYGASGQYNSIMIGSAAGANATVSNPSLSTPFNNIFIGPAAGQNSNDTAYAICIGASAGKNSDDATDCVFVGNSAGLDSTQDKSIGIGKFALKGGTSESEGGVGNIEINAGFADGDRLFSNPEALGLDYRVSIK